MRSITSKQTQNFEIYLKEQEKSSATVEKYMRDVTAFLQFAQGKETNKTMVLDKKRPCVHNTNSKTT